ncbi:helix-turn-helix domain-containing protein [Peptostreptococcus equinus]|uniref:Helix-turn-helix transcriptional regulator n=1 Tax=Peptostreptococcus equinus TaxID=3003601 RepID=A0ABY7JPJ7_9FIRM|nr:helix-turn-helix transcriptional regulator [Peptostreptococcus sp. CBA3647]WAW14416.1 helix-turn-helix transcriptional regulator [Peptostreptococcus sp. CBA3647]
MIKNNLSKIMGEKLMKVSDVSENTGVSRQTIANIYNRRSSGIQFDTLNSLCTHLDCGISDIFEYVPDSDVD